MACPEASLLEEVPEEYLMVPCVQGTLRVLKAAHLAGVTRVVLTGSFASVNGEWYCGISLFLLWSC